VVADVHDLSGYAMVVLPMHYLMADSQAAALRAYVEAGGHLVVTFLSGVADEYARVRTGGYPGALRDLLGVRVEEFHPLAAPVTLSNGSTGELWSETVHTTGAQAVIHYADGRPAVTRHTIGAGTAWYVSTRLGDARLIETVAAEAGVRPVHPGLPPGVEVVRRASADASWLFVLNHTPAAHEVAANGTDLLSGTAVTGTLRIPAGGSAVIRCRPVPKNKSVPTVPPPTEDAAP
jgi:beta-galactosidase